MSDKVAPLIFLHLAKTGGTSLGVALRYIYGYRATLHVCHDDYRAPDWFVRMPSKKRRRINAVKGHVKYGIHRYFSREAKYVTILRDPVERIASLHRMYKKENPENWRANLSLSEFVSGTPETYAEFNEQTCALAGVSYKRQNAHTKETLSKAKAHLDSMPAFGLTQRYDEGLILMKRRLGWDRWPYYVKSRVGRDQQEKPSPISGEVRQHIEKQNPLDVRLYEYARNRFEDTVSEEGENFQEEVEQFQKRNRIVSTVFALPLQLYRRGRRALYLLRN